MIETVRGFIHHLSGRGIAFGVGATVAMFVGSIAFATAVVVGWRADHFVEGRRYQVDSHPVIRGLLFGLRNVAGWLLILIGLVMAIPGVPGQGVLTILIGLTLVDFPGKQRMERRLIGRPSILGAINRLRVRFKRAPLVMP